MPRPRKPGTTADRYGEKRSRDSSRQREMSASGREVGPLPKVRNARRKSKCAKSLRAFCETYLADRFSLVWSADHLTVLGRLEAAILRGGLFALAMPRGSGKTALCEAAALWAILYGHRRFVVLIGSSDGAAVELLESVKMLVETNDVLAEDFPEVCHPVRCLEGQNNRANGQTLGGVRTRIGWSASEAVFPTVAKSKASGSVIRVAGITGRVRGMKAATADGDSIRPDFVIVDDPQTDDSAESLGQTAKRERVITGALKGLAGPGKTISMAIPCTVIAPGDLSDRLLDREKNPQFRGERMRMLYTMPTRVDLWDKYGELRRASFRAGGEGEEATAFYRDHKADMDTGATVAWEARFDPQSEVSGLQAAMNLYTDNPIAFAAEYQNEPLVEAAAGMRTLDADALAQRLSGVPRGEVPRECATLTAFIDCGKKVLWYAVAAWDSKFGGSVIDYGTWPPQNRSHFRADDARPTLAQHYPKLPSEDAWLFAGLKDLTGRILGREYPRHESREPHRVGMCLIDRGWKPDVVHKFVRQDPNAAILRPSIGHSPGSTGRTVAAWADTPGEVKSPPGSPAWRWGYGKGEHAIGRRLIFGADDWKSFIADRLTTPDGQYAGLNLFQPDKDKPDQHRLLSEHVSAEFGGPGRTMDGLEYEKWAVKPNRDNHLLDCVVGCAVAASVAGLRWSSASAAGLPDVPEPPKVRVVNFREAQQNAMRDKAR